MSDQPAAETIQGKHAESHRFGAEVDRLLDLVIHSLYTEREIFLRELVANAADAIERRRFEALSDPSLLGTAEEAAVRISSDRDGRTLMISDGGIGMTHDELIAHLGTIAKSGTRAFAETLADKPAGENPAGENKEKPTAIGQFGVGFYAAFMVADRVAVTSRRAGSDAAWTWSSEGRGTFEIAPASRDAAGTDIVLHAKADATEFLEPYRLETIVRKWADFISVPITVRRDGRDQPANDGAALWRRPKADVTEENYQQFYRHLGQLFDTPYATLHWRAEGTIDFSALLFVPGSPGFEPVEEERKSKVRLHVKRMFITDQAELLPPYLRFVQGVVDTDDLPLNVSREMLQATPVLARIRKAVTNRVITELKTRSKDAEPYAKFWENFGRILKEGIWEDADARKDLTPLLRFRSSLRDGLISLDDYVARMKEGQKAIYYLTGDHLDALKASPQIEGFTAKDIEVLLLTDSIDAFWPERLGTHGGHALRRVSQAADDLDAADSAQPDVSGLLAAMKAALGEDVAEVRATARLVSSAVVLASAEHGPDLQMQRLLARAGRAAPTPPPVLEINPSHPVIAALAALSAKGDPIEDHARTLFDLARIQDGDPPRDPAAFARRVMGLMQPSGA